MILYKCLAEGIIYYRLPNVISRVLMSILCLLDLTVNSVIATYVRYFRRLVLSAADLSQFFTKFDWFLLPLFLVLSMVISKE